MGPVLRICRALDGMPRAFELAPPGCARSPAADRSAAGRPLPAARRLVSGVRRLAWLARRRRCTAAASPVAESAGLPPDEDAAGDGHLTRGHGLFTPACALALKGGQRPLAAAAVCRPRGRSAKAWSPSTAQQTFVRPGGAGDDGRLGRRYWLLSADAPRSGRRAWPPTAAALRLGWQPVW